MDAETLSRRTLRFVNVAHAPRSLRAADLPDGRDRHCGADRAFLWGAHRARHRGLRGLRPLCAADGLARRPVRTAKPPGGVLLRLRPVVPRGRERCQPDGFRPVALRARAGLGDLSPGRLDHARFPLAPPRAGPRRERRLGQCRRRDGLGCHGAAGDGVRLAGGLRGAGAGLPRLRSGLSGHGPRRRRGRAGQGRGQGGARGVPPHPPARGFRLRHRGRRDDLQHHHHRPAEGGGRARRRGVAPRADRLRGHPGLHGGSPDPTPHGATDRPLQPAGAVPRPVGAAAAGPRNRRPEHRRPAPRRARPDHGRALRAGGDQRRDGGPLRAAALPRAGLTACAISSVSP